MGDGRRQRIYTPCPEKRTDSIFAVTSTNLDNFSQFFSRIILTIRVTEKIVKCPINTCTTLRNDDVIVTSLKNAVVGSVSRETST